MDFVAGTIERLKGLSALVGNNYGWGIILLTIVVRLAMWPLSVSQQRSMKEMQIFQPKMKAIQDRYKNDPQMMQKKMMEFYQEHKFNPMSGCWPLLIQMPIFILLYSALMSPQFIQMAGDAKFFFVQRLDATLRGNAGISFDGTFNASRYDTFSVAKNIVVYLENDEQIKDLKVLNSKKALQVQGDILPDEPIDLKISLDSLNLKYSQLEKVVSADVTVTNNNTRESENIKFTRDGSILKASVPTKKTEGNFHLDVLLLVILFGASMVVTQKIMMAQNKNQQTDPTQQMMQKTMGTMMPIMLTATFIFIPIPAGVLLYLISSNIIQVGQTIIINKQIDEEMAKKKADKQQKVDASGAKIVEAKEIKTVKEDSGEKEDK